MTDINRRSAALLALPAFFAAGAARAQGLTPSAKPVLAPAPMASTMNHAMASDMVGAMESTGSGTKKSPC